MYKCNAHNYLETMNGKFHSPLDHKDFIRNLQLGKGVRALNTL